MTPRTIIRNGAVWVHLAKHNEALREARNEALEEAAKEAESYFYQHEGNEIAAAIRALKSSRQTEGGK